MNNSIDTVINLVANGSTISKALEIVYETRRVEIPFNDKDFDVPVTEMKLGCRAENALLRNKIKTINEFINAWKNRDQHPIKGFGNSSAEEVFEKILDAAWDKMSNVERGEFLLKVDSINKSR